MNKYIKFVILLLFLMDRSNYEGTYIGLVSDDITRKELLKCKNKIFKFKINEKEILFGIEHDIEYSILNKLVENEEYIVKIDDNNIITYLENKDDNKTYDSYIKGTPGKKSVKNLIKTAIEPLGSTLYINGGGWNVQDDGASDLCRTIGVPMYWVNFFNERDENYDFNNYYPNYEWNRYHYLGLDCSGYIGWIVYNVMNTENNNYGYVTSSTKMAYSLANKYNLGIFNTYSKDNMNNKDYYEMIIYKLKPCDIVSIKGHTYMIIGVCSDNSVIIINSTVTDSIVGISGGGVQFNILSLNNDIDNEAYKLISKYMEKYYNDWYKRYPVVVKDIENYFNFEDEYTGIFSWNILEDDDNYLNMNGEELLKDIFNE